MQPSIRKLLFFLILTALSILGISAVQARYEFLTRGIPAGFSSPIPQGHARFGLNVQLLQFNDTELTENLAEIAQMGIPALKQVIYYPGNSPPTWDAYDRIVNATQAAGLELVILLDGNPADSFAPPLDLDEFAAWAGEFAGRYPGQIAAYIIWDEPNLASHWGGQDPNPAGYAALLAASAEAIRNADPQAIIVAGPLAPTVETGPQNINEPQFLEQLYAAGAAGAFDVVAAKPYGFDTGPDDRRVNVDLLNFSRIILLREAMVRHGDEEKAVWAGNWGWNSLPAGWQGDPSIWGQTSEAQQAQHIEDGWQRALQEWPWMGFMFLENWVPDAPADDPVWGFNIKGRPAAAAISTALASGSELAYPGFHPAGPDQPGQSYSGTWRFSPEFGADISLTGDQVILRFWGTDLALRVRRADYRARLHITVDGQPANNLPQDEFGAALVLTTPDSTEDMLTTETVARNLPAGEHEAIITAYRGWDQWALNGFSPAYQPSATPTRLVQGLLAIVAVVSLGLAVQAARNANWQAAENSTRQLSERLGAARHLALTSLAGVVVGVSGYLTWGGEAAGIYRRLGDFGQLTLTAAAASLFYVTPSFLIYMAALVVLFLLIYARPAWGMAIVTFSFPLYVVPKPMLGYQFSPVEIFLLVTTLATLLRVSVDYLIGLNNEGIDTPGNGQSMWKQLWTQTGKADLAVMALVVVATLSLFFTTRLNVAQNEWRVVIIEPALFYLLWRIQKLKDSEVWTILDAFILGGVLVAGYGLVRYAMGENVISVVGGLSRLRSLYGSPNNVALYLGRIIPFLGAMLLLGNPENGLRRWLYPAALLPIGLAMLLTFSKGAFFLGLPITGLILLVLWRRAIGGKIWPWVLGVGIITGLVLVATNNIPAVSTRLNLSGYTSVLRLNLWQSSLSMIADHPLTGVGLDNFLYEYRGRYILDAAWQEPDLNHPHNIVLDFWTRLGLPGLMTGIWLFTAWGIYLVRIAVHAFPGRKAPPFPSRQWLPIVAGLIAAFGQTIAHGLVDHSFFLIDLAFTFFLFLGLTIWLNEHTMQVGMRDTSFPFRRNHD